MIEELVLLLIWLVCGFFAYGRTYAHFYTEFPNGSHKWFCWLAVAAGFSGLIVSLFLGRHGFKWSGLEKERGE